MPYKIVFLDIDGTILPNSHVIQESTKEAVFQLKKKGIIVVIATGRPIIHTVEYAEELEIDSYITFNGAHAMIQGNSLFAKKMDDGYVRHQIDTAKKHGHNILLRTIDNNYFSQNAAHGIPSFVDEAKIPMIYVQNDIPSSILGSCIFLEDKNHSFHYEGYKDYELAPWTTTDGHAIYDVQSRSINKGTAIRDYLSHIGLEPSQAVAFGDGLNDTDMLQYVGMGVAMGNAHKGLLPYSNMMTTSVEDNGIYNGLKRIGLI